MQSLLFFFAGFGWLVLVGDVEWDMKRLRRMQALRTGNDRLYCCSSKYLEVPRSAF